MPFSSRSLLIGAALLASASGCGRTIEREGAPRPSDAGRPGDAADADDTGDEDDDGDVGEIGDPGTSARSSLCTTSTFSGTAADAVAVAWGQDDASLVLRDGSVVALDVPTEVPPPNTTAYVSVAASAGGVVVSRGWTVFGDVTTAHSTVRWFDRRGALVDEVVSDEGLWGSGIGADGTTVLYRSLGTYGYVVRLADGSLRDLEGIDVWGEPLASGWLRGFDNVQARAVLVNPSTLERRELDSGVYPTLVDDGFAYLEQGPGHPVLVHVTPEATVRTELSTLVAPAVEYFYLAAVPRSRWASLFEYVDGRRWRLDWTTGAVEPIDAPPPAGSEILTDACGLAQPTVTSSGEIVAGLRSGGDGQAALGGIAGGWEPVGHPYAQPGSFGVTEMAGTFVVTAGDASMVYCPILEWDEPASPDALSFDKVQIVRPELDAVHVLDAVDTWSVTASQDGGCVSFTRGGIEGAELRRSVLDVATGETRALPGDLLTWIP